VSTLAINRDMLGLKVSTPHFSLNFLFSFSLTKPSLFPAYHKTCLSKMTISNSFTVESSWNLRTRFGTHFQRFSPLGIIKSCRSWEKYPFHRKFHFPAETHNFLSKTMISESLTVGLSWNFDMWFAFHFHTSLPLGFAKEHLQMEKYSSHVDSGMKASIPSLFL